MCQSGSKYAQDVRHGRDGHGGFGNGGSRLYVRKNYVPASGVQETRDIFTTKHKAQGRIFARHRELY